MGLIYVNPEGAQGRPDPLASAQDIRITFGRMAMNDAETVALIAGGHTFGKCHRAAPPKNHVGPEPEGAPLTQQGLGWYNTYLTGKAADTITSGLEGAWTAQPTVWDHGYFTNLFEYEWELTKSPGGAYQWQPKQSTTTGYKTVLDAHDPLRQPQAPIVLTSDLALLADPVYRRIALYYYQNPQAFQDAFAHAWYKLTHRDLGPHVRLLGPEVPATQLWQDPVPPPPPNSALLDTADQAWLKTQLLSHPDLTVTRLVETAWAAASTFRQTDKRGGANGGRLRLLPQCQWLVNQPAQLTLTLAALQDIQS
jgi:catalase-peroxidase